MKKGQSECGIILLAAGLGKRMKSSLPKVLHQISGQPIIFHILDRVVESAPRAPICIVVGHQGEAVKEAILSSQRFADLDIAFVIQSEQKGTGHALMAVMESEWGKVALRKKMPLLVLPGDTPLISSQLITQMIEPLSRNEALRLLTCKMENPRGYGRIVRRRGRGPIMKIVEEKDATAREKAIDEVGVSIYFFQAPFLAATLPRLSNKNAQAEYYLTDVIASAVKTKKSVDTLIWNSSVDLQGINDPWELARANTTLNNKYIEKLSKEGVRFLKPESCLIDVSVKIAQDVTIFPNVILTGITTIAEGSTIGPGVVLKNVQVGTQAEVRAGTFAEDSAIGAKAKVGPYAHLRPQSFVGEEAKIGNFVELKKATIGPHTSIAHLSYVGDAEIGQRVNIGCGFITCNFDGRIIDGQRKHKTIIEDDVFVGSDCQAVAPIRIARGSYIASGSTITEDVEADSLAIARSRQVTKVGYAKKIRGGS